MNIRGIRDTDSNQLLALQKLRDQETQFMMLEPGDRTSMAKMLVQSMELLSGSTYNKDMFT